jgi:serine/threonine-protein kinase
MGHRTIAAAAFAAAFFMSAPVFAASWGAIAYSPSTRATGYSWDAVNVVDAETTALQYCDQNANDCISAITFHDACGAVASGDGKGWGADWGIDEEIAQDTALQACYAHGNQTCKVVRWQCSFD